ncbi:L,D-transpeptidase family protein [Indioceanicola profundi]|uniref:L,D-transpeptidase family protein n=1 Tax=Indioceanicola profundi TaxID=2220096 RepID=UPI000E6AABDC|nr:L,D-transpeptidase family protein [Indioceanicola profundi]
MARWVNPRILAGALALSLLAAAPAPAQLVDLHGAFRERLLSGEGLPAPDRAGRDLDILRAFYDGRGGQPVWIVQDRPTDQASRLLASLAAADREGLTPRDYGVARITALMERGDSPQALAELELLLSHAALNYARDLDVGRIEPKLADPELYLDRAEPDPLALLRSLAGASDPGTVLDAMAPRRSDYTQLRAALAAYRTRKDAGGWPAVPAGETLRPGERQDRVPALRSRLAATGEYAAEHFLPPDPLVYDPALEEAVRRFQRTHGLEPDGVVGAATLAAMNVTVDQRIEQIRLNMERWRWMPDELGPNYLLVNLAGFTLELFESDRVIHTARVVVGTPYQKTPVFSDSMTYLEVNPYWNVPPSIAKGELLPKLQEDPYYLARNGYTLFSDWSENAIPLDAALIDWSKVRPETFGYKIRQDPGDNNALGRIKFMFPNQFDIYLHDTPSRRLFSRANRTFSHGCIRVEDPFALAERVLAMTGTKAWDRTRLDATLLTGQRQVIRLATPLPIHLSYITAFVDETGEMQFRNDIYGRDAKLAAALRRSRIPWPEPAADAARAFLAPALMDPPSGP